MQLISKGVNSENDGYMIKKLCNPQLAGVFSFLRPSNIYSHFVSVALTADSCKLVTILQELAT